MGVKVPLTTHLLLQNAVALGDHLKQREEAALQCTAPPGHAQGQLQSALFRAVLEHTQSLKELSSSREILLRAAFKMQHSYKINACFCR